MRETQVVFGVIYEWEAILKAGAFLARCDLGIGGATAPMREVLIWRTTHAVDAAYITRATETIRAAFAANGRVTTEITCLLPEGAVQ